MKITTNFIKQTKRHLSASGSILLPLALKWRLVGVVAMCVLSVFATQSVSAASLEITVSPNPLSVDVSPTKDGSFSKADGTLSVSSDVYWGYTLSIQSGDDTGSNALKNGTNEIPSITGNLTESQFAANSWGFAFAKGTSPSTTFQPGPKNVENKTLATTNGNGADTTKSEDKYTFTLGAKVNNTIPTGAYSNTFVFMATANTASYTITYDAGTAGDDVANLPKTTNGSTYTLAGQVAAEEPKYNKYVFMGWCDTQPTKDSEGIETCKDGNQYEPSGDYQITKADGNKLELTAMWGLAMQNWDGCKALPQDNLTTITLVDSRDRNRYKVAKLKDGKCWMTENLALTNYNATPTDSDIQEGRFTIPSSSLSYENVDGGILVTYIRPDYPESGAYYSWYVATSGSGTTSMQTGNAKNSICPNGWRLPTGGSNSEATTLVNAYNNNYSDMTKSPIPNFTPQDGYLVCSSNQCALGYVGEWSAYFTSSSSSTGSFSDFDFLINPDRIIVTNGGEKLVHAQPMRCISREYSGYIDKAQIH